MKCALWIDRATRWEKVRDYFKRDIRKHLWDAARQKFVPHVYLHGSPFPKEFDEAAVYYHGGTAVAIEAGILTQDEIARALAAMNENVRKAGASSIGLTMYPPIQRARSRIPRWALFPTRTAETGAGLAGE